MKNFKVKGIKTPQNVDTLIIPSDIIDLINFHIGQQLTLGRMEPIGIQVYKITNINSSGVWAKPLQNVIFPKTGNVGEIFGEPVVKLLNSLKRR